MSYFGGGYFGSGYYGNGYWGSGGVTPPVVIIDTHDGGRQKRRLASQKEARERLRAQIRQAIDGPQAQFIIPALERVAATGDGDLAARVDIGEVLAQTALWRSVLEAADAYAAREAEIDADDEEVISLL
jgi:hypothetical protein